MIEAKPEPSSPAQSKTIKPSSRRERNLIAVRKCRMKARERRKEQEEEILKLRVENEILQKKLLHLKKATSMFITCATQAFKCGQG